MSIGSGGIKATTDRKDDNNDTFMKGSITPTRRNYAFGEHLTPDVASQLAFPSSTPVKRTLDASEDGSKYSKNWRFPSVVEMLFQGVMNERSSSTLRTTRRSRDRLNSLPGTGQRMISCMLLSLTTRANSNSLGVEPNMVDELSGGMSGGTNELLENDKNLAAPYYVH